MRLPRIYTLFQQGEIFTIESARHKLGSRGNTLRKRLSELGSRGYITPIRQGLYRLNALGKTPSEMQVSHPFSVAVHINNKCYLAYQSALQLHAKSFPKEGSLICVVSQQKFNRFQFEGHRFVWCQGITPIGLETQFVHDLGKREVPILMTNLEKTMVDCMRKPMYCPRVDDFLTLCQSIHKTPDFSKIEKYLNLKQTSAVYNRFGFILELLSSHWSVPEGFLNLLEKQASRKHIEWVQHPTILKPAKSESDVKRFGATRDSREAPNSQRLQKSLQKWRIQLRHKQERSSLRLNLHKVS